jgi:sec-independent protein translocase protein TatA
MKNSFDLKGGESNMFMNDLSPWHLILILAIALIIFGPGKLPDLGKSLGEAMRSFRQSSSENIEKKDLNPPQEFPESNKE